MTMNVTISSTTNATTLKCSTSLWSADLANLAAEIKRVEPYSERFHIDVFDGQYMQQTLFFPEMVQAMRKHTQLPFEVHLFTVDPLSWVGPFINAGADIVLFALDTASDPAAVIRAINARGKQAGISLRLDEPVSALEPVWQELDVVCILGTEVGVKGAGMDPSVPDKIRQARQINARRKGKAQVEADGGIRRNTVPLMHAAGADFIVPGSLMFGGDPKEMRQWLAAL